MLRLRLRAWNLEVRYRRGEGSGTGAAAAIPRNRARRSEDTRCAERPNQARVLRLTQWAGGAGRAGGETSFSLPASPALTGLTRARLGLSLIRQAEQARRIFLRHPGDVRLGQSPVPHPQAKRSAET